MQTITIKTNNAQAIKLLEDLEALNLIQVIRQPAVNGYSKPLSERLAGSISHEQADLMNAELEQMRREWNLNI